MDEKNKELIFKEELELIVENFGEGSQEGMKEALRSCQNILGYVSKANQKAIGQAFMSDEKMIGTLLKFMPSIKESKVEYEVVCCTGPRCAKNGSLEVIRTVKESLGLSFDEVSEDGRVRLSTQNCFKRCGEGPNIMVNGKFHHRMDREKARSLMEDIKKA